MTSINNKLLLLFTQKTLLFFGSVSWFKPWKRGRNLYSSLTASLLWSEFQGCTARHVLWKVVSVKQQCKGEQGIQTFGSLFERHHQKTCKQESDIFSNFECTSLSPPPNSPANQAEQYVPQSLSLNVWLYSKLVLLIVLIQLFKIEWTIKIINPGYCLFCTSNSIIMEEISKFEMERRLLQIWGLNYSCFQCFQKDGKVGAKLFWGK